MTDWEGGSVLEGRDNVLSMRAPSGMNIKETQESLVAFKNKTKHKLHLSMFIKQCWAFIFH